MSLKQTRKTRGCRGQLNNVEPDCRSFVASSCGFSYYIFPARNISLLFCLLPLNHFTAGSKAAKFMASLHQKLVANGITESGIFIFLIPFFFSELWKQHSCGETSCWSRADNKILGHDLDCGHTASDGYCFLSSGSLSDLIMRDGSVLDGDSTGASNKDCTNSVIFGQIVKTCTFIFNFSSFTSNIIHPSHYWKGVILIGPVEVEQDFQIHLCLQ